MGPSSVDHEFIRTVKALATLIADEWLLKGVLRATMIHQFLTRHEALAAVVAKEVGHSGVQAHVVPKQISSCQHYPYLVVNNIVLFNYQAALLLL